MNSLAEKYGDKVAILGFPCNQFGHQTNEDNTEFLNTLKHVRPGGGFEPAPSVTIFEKGDVNGLNAQPMFKCTIAGLNQTARRAVRPACARARFVLAGGSRSR